MATPTTKTERNTMAGNIATPFSSGGKSIKVNAAERDELKLLGVDFGDDDDAPDEKADTETEEPK